MVSAYPDTDTDGDTDAAAEHDADRYADTDAHQHGDTDADPNANADRLPHSIANGNRDDAAHGVTDSNISAVRDTDGLHTDANADMDTGADGHLHRNAWDHGDSHHHTLTRGDSWKLTNCSKPLLMLPGLQDERAPSAIS